MWLQPSPSNCSHDVDMPSLGTIIGPRWRSMLQSACACCHSVWCYSASLCALMNARSIKCCSTGCMLSAIASSMCSGKQGGIAAPPTLCVRSIPCRDCCTVPVLCGQCAGRPQARPRPDSTQTCHAGCAGLPWRVHEPGPHLCGHPDGRCARRSSWECRVVLLQPAVLCCRA